MKAVVLAAGKGVRLRPLTNTVPKAMVKLKGKPLLERTIIELKEAGIEEIIIVVGYLGEVIQKYFGESYEGTPIKYILQVEQKGTAHAIAHAEEFIKENFLVLNADVLVEKDLFKELAVVDEFDSYDAIVVGREVSDPWRYGVLSFNEDELLTGIVEKPVPGKEPSNIINAGIYRFNKKIFGAIKLTEVSERNEYEIVDSIKVMLNADAKIKVRKYAGRCIDIGTKEDLKKAEKLFE